MPREKQDYRANIMNIREVYPDVGALTVLQAAKWLNCDRRTVVSLIERRRDALPAVNVGTGKNKNYRISVEALARFIS